MPDLRAQALRLLSRREHSRAGLAKKLAAHAETEEQLAALLDTLEAQHLLSDQRYASQRVQARAGRVGNARLRHELQAGGVDDEAVTAALAESGDEGERCRAVWQKKFGALPTDAETRARQMRFLQYRGFSAEAIRRVLRAEEIG